MTINKQILYALAALFPVLLQAESMPTNPWEWWRWIGTGALAVVIALKALQSDPNVAN